jgi:hypothetical protein
MILPDAALDAVTSDELTKAAEMFNVVKQMRLRLTNINENTLDKAFESHVHTVLQKLDSTLPKIQYDEIRRVEVVMARHGLCDAAFQQVILLCQTISPDLGYLLKEIRNVHAGYFADLQQICDEFQQHVQDSESEIHVRDEQLNERNGEINRLTEAINTLDKV